MSLKRVCVPCPSRAVERSPPLFRGDVPPGIQSVPPSGTCRPLHDIVMTNKYCTVYGLLKARSVGDGEESFVAQ